MKTRFEKYNYNNDDLKRTNKNDELYQNLSGEEIIIEEDSSIATDLLDNISEIDISKIKELLDDSKDYKRTKKYNYLLDDEKSDEDYDIYEDIDNKIYDINNILESARQKRGDLDEVEQRKKLRNTQYNILSKLDLNKNNEIEKEEMVKDFFTKDSSLTDLDKIMSEKEKIDVEKTADLFESLKSTQNTVLTDPIKTSALKIKKIEEPIEDNRSNTFYTDAHAFTKEDFEGFQNLQGEVKVNNKLIKILIAILIIAIISLIIMVILNTYNI